VDRQDRYPEGKWQPSAFRHHKQFQESCGPDPVYRRVAANETLPFGQFYSALFFVAEINTLPQHFSLPKIVKSNKK
jgi:hypothetical protein